MIACCGINFYPFITFLCRISQKFGLYGHSMYFCTVKTINYKQENRMKQKFCQSCGMPLTDDVLGTNGRSSESHPSLLEDGRVVTDEGKANADGTKNEDYCMYCYKDGKFLQDCTMEEMIEHCAQFVNAVNEGLEKPITKEEYIGVGKTHYQRGVYWHDEIVLSPAKALAQNVGC